MVSLESVSAKAPGKVILFGEHAVVYGYPAISMGISLKTYASVEAIEENKIILSLDTYERLHEYTDLNDLITNIPPGFKQIGYLFNAIKKRYNIQIDKIRVKMSSDLPPGSGLGSSSSSSVALVSSISNFYDLNLDRGNISDYAFEMEKIVHGTPSGIDNTTCTYGNLIFFQNGNHRLLSVPDRFHVLITYCGIRHNTRMALEKVREFNELNPQECKQIFEKISNIVKDAESAISKGNIVKIGKLMNSNQKLLDTLGLSNHEIAKINEIAIEYGAFGSKLTGAGLGGCVVTLGTEDNLRAISTILEEENYDTYLTEIDTEGIKVARN